jgi:hypothetical protein
MPKINQKLFIASATFVGQGGGWFGFGVALGNPIDDELLKRNGAMY